MLQVQKVKRWSNIVPYFESELVDDVIGWSPLRTGWVLRPRLVPEINTKLHL